jgi:hypothetical protein
MVFVTFGFILPQTTLAITTTNDPSGYIVTHPGFYDGVARLDFVPSVGLPYSGTGALINTPSNLYILTAAHLFTDGSGNSLNPSINATFYLSGGSQTISGAQYFVNPGWTGNYTGGYDIAIIKLSSPPGTTGYNLLTTINWGFVGAVPIVGYGLGGTGQNGWGVPSPNPPHDYPYPFGTLRVAYNTLDGVYPYPNANFPSVYAYDFDSGNPANDTLHLLGGPVNLGVSGGYEGLIAEGDSGGPTFVIEPPGNDPNKYVLAGIHSFGTRGLDGLGDIDTIRNGSFGELGGDTRVAFYGDWIGSVVTPSGGEIPEPCTMILVGSGLLGLLGLRKKFRS